ncbi:hypothetical protein ASO20_02735 [Mycoplasma sp. (ex Biomphalaria glabrata)]|uniref:bifunctional riboflavin kinase/FAD synthetase n=1 Tax=Mycoplasma sp. (ex Biomphalaria glabrata) TaxID=1749074 RepID=UPI00073AD2A8|nr:bifunctional riboflavin kinase/FAD synthetase [Mycoplasma sp. (ex Biomphalaria glabrata)]ALV23551.1 hypothetical protein ASO20_02735 [Mycoplasma sp. (ex Biomphalaria glabrata)]
MKIIFWNYHNSKNLIKSPITITIGKFDGIHTGHQVVIQKTLQIAKDTKTKSAIFFFDPHPIEILMNLKTSKLTPYSKKISLLSEYDFDYCVVIKFSDSFSNCSKTWFIDELKNRFNVSNIVVGEDFKFGKNRAGNLTDLESFFNVYKLKLTTIGNDIVSTSEIIQNIKDADFEIANKKLGRRYDVIGKVVKGKQLGRKLGFPTANLSFKDEYMIPKVGIYAGYAWVKGKKYKAAISIGYTPTIDTRKTPIVEAHLLDFSHNIYNFNLKLEFVKWIRAEQKFNSLQELKSAISIDVEKIRETLD